MKLFLKDHFSFIILYLITFISLPFIINQLDGFENHYGYFSFLAILLLLIFLVIRYFRRKKMYTRLKETNLDRDNFLIYQPSSPIEKAYADQLKVVSSLFLEKEEKHQDYLQEQQLLISHAVHQMKTPVSVMQLLVQSNQMNNAHSFEAWQKVKTECDKLNFSLNQLLSYSRSTKLLSDLKIEAMPLKKIVQEVINDLKDYFIEEEIFPKVVIPADIILYSDQKWMKVVIYQLLSNAIKYGEQQSTVYVHYQTGQLSIKNKGETIPKSDINRVFDLFYTGTKGRKRREATGIGLYLVKKILNTLNHSFDLTSHQQETIFTIYLSESIGTAAK
ncbi:HAMP domain-containing sensor histidine kinase [Oceanobacillus sp. J11TS1]|uniref:sensor histidine kinase n=1 Tax=Oceanobacillus sp. J11TS1 TaxID=2807191 RepID=UPI001B02034D|nr:HAMP domain-containing sensor histidine kinase [Oceanobacillus sp. J11TS1]GIO22688.1 sensor histidine kinase [Oceanobacillus sp. J11TS1]